MSRARETIMGAIRDALGGEGGGRFPLPHGGEGEAGRPNSGRYHREGTRSQGELLDLFFHRVEEYKATVTRCHPGRLPIVISERVLARGVGILVTPPDLPGDWMAELRRGGPKLLQDLRPDPLTISQLASAHGVLTGCALAIADTGTLVLDGGPAQGRRALTLLPDYHLCVVFRDQVVETVSGGHRDPEPEIDGSSLPSHPDLGPLGHLRYRADKGGGSPRPPDTRRSPCSGLLMRIPL